MPQPPSRHAGAVASARWKSRTRRMGDQPPPRHRAAAGGEVLDNPELPDSLSVHATLARASKRLLGGPYPCSMPPRASGDPPGPSRLPPGEVKHTFFGWGADFLEPFSEHTANRDELPLPIVRQSTRLPHGRYCLARSSKSVDTILYLKSGGRDFGCFWSFLDPQNKLFFEVRVSAHSNRSRDRSTTSMVNPPLVPPTVGRWLVASPRVRFSARCQLCRLSNLPRW